MSASKSLLLESSNPSVSRHSNPCSELEQLLTTIRRTSSQSAVTSLYSVFSP
ncbi:hypothetical protein ADUPG1_008119, partial [Aduncisulcus paluster]